MDPTLQDAGALLVQLAMGVSLAACAGLRAFLPLLVVGAAGRMELIPLSDSFAWLESTPALVVFGAAVLMELLGDKIPAVDHFLDAVQVWVKPIAGTVLVASVVTELSPLVSGVLGIVLGGASAEAVHLGKAQLRLVSSVTTAGLGNPVLSVAEDAGALVGSVGAILVPLVVFLLLVVGVTVAGARIRRLVRSRSPGPPAVA